MKWRMWLLTLMVLFARLSDTSAASAMSFGLVSSDGATGRVQSYLQAAFPLDTFTQIDARFSTPSAGTLSRYDAVLVWSNYPFKSAGALGDHLAAYASGGGGVVLATFGYYGTPYGIEGDFISRLSPVERRGASLYTSSFLGSYDFSSPIMNGVDSLSGLYRDAVSATPGARVVAEWSDGNPLVVVNSEGNIAGITLYPGELTRYGLAGDYARLFGNLLTYVAGTDVSPVPEPGSILLVTAGAASLFFLKRKRYIR